MKSYVGLGKIPLVNKTKKLEDVFIKYYIVDEYIFKDDTIKVMRQKICISIALSEVFGTNIKLLPETQYFWSEYFNTKI